MEKMEQIGKAVLDYRFYPEDDKYTDGAIEDEMTYQEEEEAILAILDEIYETFVISCYLTGLIKVNKDFWTKKDDYLEHGWIKSPKKWIDPLKESSANKTALNTGQKTYKEIAAENGRDWKQQIDDNLEVIEYAKKKGYDLGGVIFDGKLGSEKEEEPKPEPPKPDDQTGDGQEEGTNDDDKGTQSGDGKEGQSASGEGQEQRPERTERFNQSTRRRWQRANIRAELLI